MCGQVRRAAAFEQLQQSVQDPALVGGDSRSQVGVDAHVRKVLPSPCHELLPLVRSAAPERASRPGTVMSWARMVPVVALAWKVEARVPAVRVRFKIRTWAQWDDAAPGFVEIDLVGHEGGNAVGEHAYTLTVTDIATGWTENQSVRNKDRSTVIMPTSGLCRTRLEMLCY